MCGKGAFGVVFRARYKEELVAVKELLDASANEEVLREFIQEIQWLHIMENIQI
jgi:hypothetical protein